LIGCEFALLSVFASFIAVIRAATGLVAGHAALAALEKTCNAVTAANAKITSLVIVLSRSISLRILLLLGSFERPVAFRPPLTRGFGF